MVLSRQQLAILYMYKTKIENVFLNLIIWVLDIDSINKLLNLDSHNT